MPLNHPDIWERRVTRNISAATEAPFLDALPEIDANINELNAGSANEMNIIYIPATDFKPEVYINNSTYPYAVTPFTDKTLQVSLDKLSSQPTSISDDKVTGAAYDVIDAATRTHVEAIVEKKYAKAMHALAPASNATATPVLLTTGVDDGTGRKKLLYKDIVTLRRKCKGKGWILVLCDDHVADLCEDRDRFADQFVNHKEGGPAPRISGFEIQSYEANPTFNTTGVKQPLGTAESSTIRQGSVAFKKSNVGKKTGLTKQYFSKAENDPINQTNIIAYRHYYICMPKELKQIGAIASAPAA